MRPALAILIVFLIVVGLVALGFGVRWLWRKRVAGWRKRAWTAEQNLALLRGQVEEAQRELAMAYAADPYVNSALAYLNAGIDALDNPTLRKALNK